MIFFNNAQSVWGEISGNASTTLLSVPNGETYTMLYLGVNSNSNDAGANAEAVCGSKDILHIHDLKLIPNIERFSMSKCSNDIQFNTTGVAQSGDKTSVHLIYVPYDTASTSQQAFSGGFSYGEVVSSVFLFASCVALIYALLYFSILGVKIKSDL